MKKIILSLALLTGSIGIAQEIEFGAKVGLNISSLRGDYPAGVNNKSQIGFHVGGFLSYPINDKITFQPELLYSTQGVGIEIEQVANTGTGSQSFSQTPKLGYLTVPIMIQYQIIDKLNVEIGPQIGFLLSAKSKWELIDSDNASNNETVNVDLLNGGSYSFLGTTFEDEGRAKTFDFGLNFGASYDLTEELFIQARYNLGLLVFDKNSTSGASLDSWNLKNSVIQFSVGYTF